MCEHVWLNCVKLEEDRFEAFGKEKHLKLGVARSMREVLMEKEIHKFVNKMIKKEKAWKVEDGAPSEEQGVKVVMAPAG